MLLQESDDRELKMDVLTEAEAIIYAAIKHEKTGHEVSKYPYQIRQSGYCILCGRYITSDTGRRICLDCREELEEWSHEIYAELYCHNCGKHY